MPSNYPEALTSDVQRVSGFSPFFEELIANDQDMAHQAFQDVERVLSADELRHRYQNLLSIEDDLSMEEKLVRLRRREMIRIVFRDLTRRASTLETTAELSHLADFCIQTALDHCYDLAVSRFGQPLGPDGEPERMVVLGMGKLGAYELNLSSDIDLIFFYSNQGQIKGEKHFSHQEFFLWLARKTIACLDHSGSVHSVFRVDMRLRPYGDSGPLVLHRAAMEKYYLEQGRDWERYAFIKARAVAGDFSAGEDYLQWMKPFIFRRTLDYHAIQSLREMKGLIARQVELKEVSHDLKLGPGGIREIEFIAQAHQLIWGGKYPELQDSRVTVILYRLSELEFMPADDVEALLDAYFYLRNCEHVLQAERDRQTHLLPSEEVSQSRLAAAMGHADYESFLQELDKKRSQVSGCFDLVVKVSAADKGTPLAESWRVLWRTSDDGALKDLRADIDKLNLDSDVEDSINIVMPALLMMASKSENPGLAEERMLPIVRAILRRSTYLVFLVENIEALERAVHLVAISPWIAEQLAAYPILLYELTDRAMREVAVSKTQLQAELRDVMRSVDADDMELQMDALRQFKLGATLKIAAMELTDQLSIMQASDGLTALAEVLLDRSLDMAWRYLEQRHGSPCDDEGQSVDDRLAIVGYGKAGGLELAYGSDLDLVFLCPSYIKGYTDGEKSINNNVFYVRVGQRIIHILTTFTRFGILYSADLRLRPQGNKGPLVATISAFDRYQASEAWTWEHQAIIRARMIAGDAALGQQFANIRSRTLQKDRDKPGLLAEVLSMREKMRAHLGTRTNAGAVEAEDPSDVLARFDLKHDAGAIVDIEFMVQYAVLAWAADMPALSRWTDVMRLLEDLGDAGLYSDVDVNALQRAYLAFRSTVHQQWLGLESDFERLQGYRQDVHRIWQEKMAAV